MIMGANIATFKTMLSRLENHIVHPNELKSALSLYINMDRYPAKAEVIKSLHESLPVESLFHTDIISGPTVELKILQDYLLLRDHTYTQYPGKRVLSYGVETSVFTNTEDRKHAVQCLNALRKTPIPLDLQGATFKQVYLRFPKTTIKEEQFDIICQKALRI